MYQGLPDIPQGLPPHTAGELPDTQGTALRHITGTVHRSTEASPTTEARLLSTGTALPLSTGAAHRHSAVAVHHHSAEDLPATPEAEAHAAGAGATEDDTGPHHAYIALLPSGSDRNGRRGSFPTDTLILNI